MAEKRNKKGQFKRGHSGGPGRGNRKPSKRMTLEDVELALSQDLRSKDPKIRLPATRLLLQLKRQFPDQDDGPVLDPFVHRFLNLMDYKEKTTGRYINAEEAFDLMEEHIKNCPDSPIIPSYDFVEIENDDL